ncbi:MAG: RNA chaperone Hfq [Burkholderiales bacterium]
MNAEKASPRPKPAASKRARATPQPTESRFLAQWQNEKKTVEIYLINGVRIEGRIVSFDPQVVLVESGTTDKVYKTAISTIQEAKKRTAPRVAKPAAGAPARTPTVVVKRVRRAPPR